jgi:hypothetical protein
MRSPRPFDGRQGEASRLINADDQPAPVDRERSEILREFLVPTITGRDFSFDVDFVPLLEGTFCCRQTKIPLGRWRPRLMTSRAVALLHDTHFEDTGYPLPWPVWGAGITCRASERCRFQRLPRLS